MKNAPKPNPGDRVTVSIVYPTEEDLTGTVESVLATQFVMRTDDGRVRFAFFNEPWRNAT
jgi:hypothetical protein